MTDYIQVMTTVEQKQDAEKIAKHLLEKRLAACVQVIGPMTSFFWWKGRIDRAEEYICLIKSRFDFYQEVETAIKNVHPYDVPEILAIAVVNGEKDYLNWMDAEILATK